MIRWPNLFQVLGYFILALTACLAIPLIFAGINRDGGMPELGKATLISAFVGGVLYLAFRPSQHELTHREGILLVNATWISGAVLGALPFFFSSYFDSFSDALFESISGFTTTGATVLADIETLPMSLLLWRSLTQWLGGMGIILLGIAILPLIGAGGIELYRAEFSGARSEKLKPRIAETATSLWKIYLAFTLASYAVLRLVGMQPLDALCHAFTTMATGGFSTRTASIQAFDNPHIEMVLVFFMVLAGLNFTQHYRFLIEWKPRAVLRDPETLTYLALLVGATVALTASLLHFSPLREAGRLALFQVVSIMTGTGFSTADFGGWSSFAQLLLLALMFAGGCTGSTAGGMKTFRLLLLLRVVSRDFRRIAERRGVFAIRLNHQPLAENTVQSVLNLVYLAFLINFISCMALAALGVDILTAISAVAASMFNVGPGLGQVGPIESYGTLPQPAKWVLSFCMLAGRLEFYTLLVLFTPTYWRK